MEGERGNHLLCKELSTILLIHVYLSVKMQCDAAQWHNHYPEYSPRGA